MAGANFTHLLRFFVRHVWDNDAVDAGTFCVGDKFFKAVVRLAAAAVAVAHEIINVAHTNQRNFGLGADFAAEFENFFKRDTVFESGDAGILDNGTVGERVAERNADFDNVSAGFFRLKHCVKTFVNRGRARRDVHEKSLASGRFQRRQFFF